MPGLSFRDQGLPVEEKVFEINFILQGLPLIMRTSAWMISIPSIVYT
jgi:hypothetical protein